jgi:tetratricopeptide (TPR) repeat protein
MVAGLLLLASHSISAQAKENFAPAVLRGTVRDSQGKTVINAEVQLLSKDSERTLKVRTDARGLYEFPAVNEGVYSLRVVHGLEAADVPSLVLVSNKTSTVDLMLASLHSAASSSSDAQFFDEPQFSVSGVTETSNLGGHGSDIVVRTRESLAKQAASLREAAPSAMTPNFAATEKSLREALHREPESFDANHDLGSLLLENNRAKEAIPYLQRAAEINSADYENTFALARAEHEAGNYDAARDRLRKLMGLKDKAELHHLLGDVQERLGDPLEAVRQYQRAAEINSSERYVFDWGSELLLHHAPEPAIQVFNRGHELYPRSSRMLIGLGAAWFARGSNDQAVTLICKASDLNPSDPIPYLFLGKLLRAEPKPSDEAVEKLRGFVTFQPDSAEANYYYAVAFWKRSQGTQSTAVLQIESLLNNAIRLDPKFAEAHLQLGILHDDQRDYSKAASDFQRAIQLDPQMEAAHYRLAQVYRQLGETDKSRKELRVYEHLTAKSAQQIDRERHEIRQFVYTLRDHSATQKQ